LLRWRVLSVIKMGAAVLSVVPLALGYAYAQGQSTEGSAKHILKPAERLQVIRRAQVWQPTDVASMDLNAGPKHGAFPPGDTVTCDYVKEAFTGASPKFACVIAKGDRLKVRYGVDNGEVYAGIATSRLLWALGFGADQLYPVHVVCRGCPKELHGDGAAVAGETRFDVAGIERKMPGVDIETSDGPGWAWPELAYVQPATSAMQRMHRDALTLLAVFVQHSDNKTNQQRLTCLGEHAGKAGVANCAEPFMMIHDVGQTFGRANLWNRSSVGSVNLDMWAHTPIWKDAKRCIGDLAAAQTATLSNPTISEAGRKFLADLLIQLSDAQLRDLFTVARFADKPVNGRAGRTTVDAWVDAFKHKRDEIASVTCPS
jgi:hypothetical protein